MTVVAKILLGMWCTKKKIVTEVKREFMPSGVLFLSQVIH